MAEAGPVLYIASEGTTGYPSRVAAWRAVYGQGGMQLHFCFQEIPFLNPVQFEAFLQHARSLRPALVIVDTLARNFGGSENSTHDMGAFVNACARFQRELGAAMLVVHHATKDGDGERGSSALRGAADTMLQLTADECILRLASSKSKDSAAFSDRFYRLQEVALDQTSSYVLVQLEEANEADRFLQISYVPESEAGWEIVSGSNRSIRCR